ncbi:hypothetical protein CIW49_24490 [Mycolicibacterium sp. P1-18]|uniref:copper resistance D family protein n=1 Tax=Mycolicibacterium sp. P1-18 TaxID=2024615 RepID=UPI0011F23D21|nr:CopD family protein [Mycolicibacterium sp. P1-18]KAA0094710.1 hypothetical protein CIW49_24490 [Mycolicibacterium sp. P1-18]
MPGSVPPPPSLTDVAGDVVLHLGVSLSAAVGLTVALLAIPEDRGGVVAATVRTTVAVPAAAVVAVAAVVQFVGAGPAGVGAYVQAVVFATVVVGLLVLSRRASRWLGGGIAVLAAIAILTPLLPAPSSPIAVWMRSLLTGVHVLGAMFWVGGLVVLASAGLVTRRRGRRCEDGSFAERASRDWHQVWERFGVVALWAVGALIVSGAWLSWSHVGTPAQLLTTTYGRYLAFKLVLVVALVAAGSYNVRVLTPRVREARRRNDFRSAFHSAVEHFPAVVTAEACLAVAVFAIVPFLRGSARSEAGWAAARSFDLTVLVTGLVLVLLTGAALWAGSRKARR